MSESQPPEPKQQNITDRVLVILQTRFPNEFEIAVLTAQNEMLVERVNESEVVTE